MSNISLEFQNKIHDILLQISLNKAKIIAETREIQGKVDANKVKIDYINSNILNIKNLIEKFLSYLKTDIIQFNNKFNLLKLKISDIEKDLHKLHISLTLNDGQTNQCFMAVTKLLLKFLKILSQLYKNLNNNKLIYLLNPGLFKKACYKIIIAILISIGISIFSWIGVKYWDAFIYVSSQLKNINTTNNVQQNILNNNK